MCFFKSVHSLYCTAYFTFLYADGVQPLYFLKILLKYETDEKPTSIEISEIFPAPEISRFSALHTRTKFKYSVNVEFVAFLKRRQK